MILSLYSLTARENSQPWKSRHSIQCDSFFYCCFFVFVVDVFGTTIINNAASSHSLLYFDPYGLVGVVSMYRYIRLDSVRFDIQNVRYHRIVAQSLLNWHTSNRRCKRNVSDWIRSSKLPTSSSKMMKFVASAINIFFLHHCILKSHTPYCIQFIRYVICFLSIWKWNQTPMLHRQQSPHMVMVASINMWRRL